MALLVLAFSVAASAQSVDEIKASADYLWGEGRGETNREADNEALQDLISKISLSVESDFESIDTEVQHSAHDFDSHSAVKMVLRTYSQATLQNTERLLLSDEPDARVFRYVRRSEVEKIFASRKAKLDDMLLRAAEAEAEGKLDDALRNCYWAYALLQSIPAHNTLADADGRLLINSIPDRMHAIFSGIRVASTRTDGDVVELQILYKGQPVTGLDYTYWDGMDWGMLCSARDGRGLMELRPGVKMENPRIKCEYEYVGESHIDKEIASVVEVMKGRIFKDATIFVDAKASADASPAQVPASAQSGTAAVTSQSGGAAVAAAAPRSTLTLLEGEEATPYARVMERVVNAIRTHDYASVNDCFTPDGQKIFDSLIHYGNARIMGEPDLQYFPIRTDEVVCRSLPICFSFQNNSRRFVENITFTFNGEGLIDCIAFGLDEKAADDILRHAQWGDVARKTLNEFLENYKTAYALKRWDYLNSIFDEHAVIISGKVVTRATTSTGDGQVFFANNKYVQQTRKTKDEYMRDLRRSFDSKEYINIHFGENDVVKAGAGGEVYGIQIQQDYFSNNYGDSGYLFLMVDLNNPKEPIIKVRVWNPERDPDFKGINSF